MLDLRDNAAVVHPVHTMRVKKNGTNADTVVTIQTSDISRSASSIFTNTMLFCDFSSLAIKDTGCYHPLLGTWGLRGKLFISRIDAEDMKVFEMPADRPLTSVADAKGIGEAVEKEWGNPEWSNHPYYAASNLLVDRLYSTASGWDHTTNYELVYLVDLKDSSYIRLIESTDSSYTSKTNLTYPFLWVERSTGFQEDSTWLNRTIWERAGQVRCFNNKWKSFDTRSGFFNGKDITEIVLYALNGQKIASVRGTWKSIVPFKHVFKNVHSGTYFIGLKTKGAQKEFYRLIVGK